MEFDENNPHWQYGIKMQIIDVAYTFFAVIVVLTMFYLSIHAQIIDKPPMEIYIPFLVVGLLGIVIKMEGQIMSIAGYMVRRRDDFEMIKDIYRPTKFSTPIADVLMIVPAAVMLLRAEAIVWKYFSGSQLHQKEYLYSTLALIVLGVFGWIYAATQVKKAYPKL